MNIVQNENFHREKELLLQYMCTLEEDMDENEWMKLKLGINEKRTKSREFFNVKQWVRMER
jgi:hypothetical protein